MPHTLRALIDSTRFLLPPPRSSLRRALTVMCVMAVCAVGWRLVCTDASESLEARQNRARKKIGHGLDALFKHQRGQDNLRSLLPESLQVAVRLDATFIVASELHGKYTDSDCAVGFSAAFEEALGAEVVQFSTSAEGEAAVVISGEIVPSGDFYSLRKHTGEFPGIEMRIDIDFLGKNIYAKVRPDREFEFTHHYYRFSDSYDNAPQIASGFTQSACQQAGYVLLEKLTRWRKPLGPTMPVGQ